MNRPSAPDQPRRIVEKLESEIVDVESLAPADADTAAEDASPHGPGRSEPPD